MMKKLLPKLVGASLNTLSLVAPSKAGRIGFNIFCTPLVPPVKPHHRQFLDTAHQFNFYSDGVQLKAYQWGTGEKKILFLHGWQSHSFRWKKYINAFPAEEYTLYAFDAPAHGLSQGKYINIPIYSNAITSFFKKVESVHSVIAHSMGSFSVLHALHNHDHLEIGKLILMGSPGEANDFIRFYQNQTGLSSRAMGLILEYFVATLNRTPDYFSAPAFASSAKMPGLIVHDEGDDEAPYAHAVRIHKAWPASRLVTTKGFGHNLKSHKVIDLVRDFVHEGSLEHSVLTH